MIGTALYYQTAKMTESDYLSIDGSEVHESSKRNKAFQTLQDTASLLTNDKIPWCTSVRGYKILKGALEDRDEKGRTMTFVYIAHKKKSWEDFRQSLIEELNQKGLKMTTETLDSIKEVEKNNNLKRWCMWIVAMLIGALIAFVTIYSTKENPQEESPKDNNQAQLVLLEQSHTNEEERGVALQNETTDTSIPNKNDSLSPSEEEKKEETTNAPNNSTLKNDGTTEKTDGGHRTP